MEQPGQRVEVDPPGSVDGHLTPGTSGHRAAARHDSRTAGCSTAEHTHTRRPPVPHGGTQRPEHGQIGRLGAARGEDDLARVSPEVGRHLVPRLFEQAPGPLGRTMAPGRVPEGLGAGLRHGLRHFGPQRCRGPVIEIRRGRSLM